jgi:MFS family permease
MHSPASGPALASAPGSSTKTVVRGAYLALLILFSMNLLNYVDRYVFAAVGELIIRDLELDDFWFGILAGSFMLVYTILTPFIGWMGDRYSRRKLLAFGVGLWSVATVGTTFSRSFSEMCFWRALLGVGEASYGIVAPTLLADLFPAKLRGRVMGIFYLALPLGGALGYSIGGYVSNSTWGSSVAAALTGSSQGWRAAFLIVGLPGLAAALGSMVIRDPGRGASEGLAAGKATRPGLADYAALFRTPSYLFNIAGLAAVTFATGAYANWAPAFYQRVRDLPVHKANVLIGVLTAVGGLVGILLGIWLPDRLRRRTLSAYQLWAAFVVLLAVPFGLGGILEKYPPYSLSMLFVAMVLLASTLGPCNTVPANVIPPNRRAAAYALNIFLIHLLGDISSPPLIGWLSDYLGRPSVVHSELGSFLASIGASPVYTPKGPKNLTAGMLAVIPMLLLGGIFFLFGSRYLARDEARVRKPDSGSDMDGDFATLH